MRNKIRLYLISIIFLLTIVEVKSQEEFNFDVKEIEILEEGNLFVGKKKGKIISNNGIVINANEFVYNKKLNLLNARGNVKIYDKPNEYYIYAEKIIYNKNKELITTEENSKAISLKDNSTINANKFEYYKNQNLINAIGNVKLHDKLNDYIIHAEKIIYNKNKELITTEENSKAVSLKNNVKITARKFIYLKNSNFISAKENVFVEDSINKYSLSSDYLEYLVNEDKINSRGNTKLLNLNNNSRITSEILKYDVSNNIIKAENNVILVNQEKNYKIYSDKITYLKNIQKFVTKGKTSAEIKSKYRINSSNVTFLEKSMELYSNNKTSIKDNNNFYNTSKFKYYIDSEFLKAEDILIISNYKNPQNDKYYFENGMINLNNQDFVAGKTEINLKKDIFNNTENDPRIVGISSKKNENLTFIKKGIFTSCKKTEDCPPWELQASEIKHDQNKKEIFYKNAILKVYDIPVLYFPKFFHPDPSVKRRSGLLKPTLNDSNILGSSLTIPYFHVLSDNSDLTLAPSRYDSGSNMIQNEYRSVNKNSNILINFGHVNDYNSTSQNKKKNISYIFSKINFDLNLDEFSSSNLDFNFEKVTNDNFLKIFDSNLNENTTTIKPSDNTVMNSELVLYLNHENFNLTTGFSSYENLQNDKNDRYHYILPYYDFNKTIISNFVDGSLNFNSNGSNDLNNTNQLTTKVTNNLSYSSFDYITKSGFKNNLNINLKNLNSVGKNVAEYKTSPQMELSSLFEANTSIPFKKGTKENISYLTPKASARFNPSDMKNHKNAEKIINVGNIFSVDRFGLGNSYESGRSITLGLDYRNEKTKKLDNETLKEMNKYFELKLATVFRDKEENFIPSKSTLNKKTSNIFGEMSTNLSENLEINYNFALDNNLDNVQYNDLTTALSFNNFSTSFNLVQAKKEMGNEDFIQNTTAYNFDDKNFIKFNTRRNRKIDLTEFYDLVYEYKNDCLTAGVKYKKTYYEDKDLKPTEDLFFTITFIPLTTFDQKVDKF